MLEQRSKNEQAVSWVNERAARLLEAAVGGSYSEGSCGGKELWKEDQKEVQHGWRVYSKGRSASREGCGGRQASPGRPLQTLIRIVILISRMWEITEDFKQIVENKT